MAKKKSSKKKEEEESMDEDLEDDEDLDDEDIEDEDIEDEDIEDEDIEDEEEEDKEKVSDEDLEDELLGNLTEEKTPKKPIVDEDLGTPEDEFLEEEEEVETKDYKYLKAHIIEQHDNVYRIEFIDGSHGFLNYLSSNLLQDKNVRFSAYKATSLDPPVLTLIIEPDASVKKILESACNKMKQEIKALKEALSSSI